MRARPRKRRRGREIRRRFSSEDRRASRRKRGGGGVRRVERRSPGGKKIFFSRARLRRRVREPMTTMLSTRARARAIHAPLRSPRALTGTSEARHRPRGEEGGRKKPEGVLKRRRQVVLSVMSRTTKVSFETRSGKLNHRPFPGAFRYSKAPDNAA